ncbi:MAG: 1-deoxy-D-xylulose-5-phosphate reductoisomerase [Candidatus Gracilibacteria bacterium]|jgi:1-deoxy-D-xylulose-5-phosphate reductoisomerase
MKKGITVIGSTGSLGRQTLDVVRANPARFKVFALAANKNIQLLKKQLEEFNPQMVVVFSANEAKKLQKELQPKPDNRARKITSSKKMSQGVALSKIRPQILSGVSGLEKISTHKRADQIVFVSNGLSALSALCKAIKAHKQIAIGTKELIVAEGKKIMALARKNKVQILPIDSEHSAIFQCLQGENPANVEKVILTCSGGPFYGMSKETLANVTPAQALNHPTWKMGAKISVDSATLINKGFEKIEAMHLFNLKENQVEILIHPESVIHSFVVFKDGSIKAQMATPDMRLPISYALSYPDRLKNNWPSFDFTKMQKLTFLKPDFSILKGPELVCTLAQKGRTSAKKLIQANEKAVQKFLNNEISFLEIYNEIMQIK